jgi:hypothetical protein
MDRAWVVSHGYASKRKRALCCRPTVTLESHKMMSSHGVSIEAYASLEACVEEQSDLRRCLRFLKSSLSLTDLAREEGIDRQVFARRLCREWPKGVARYTATAR